MPETQAEIAERLGWSKSKVKQYSALLNNVVTEVLDLARSHESGRVTSEVTSVTFTEGWFRTSGLYDLNRDGETQAEIAERLGWNRDKVAKRSRLLNEVVPAVLELARKHQNGRGTGDVPSGTFSEYWFRTSDLYDLNRQRALSRIRPTDCDKHSSRKQNTRESHTSKGSRRPGGNRSALRGVRTRLSRGQSKEVSARAARGVFGRQGRRHDHTMYAYTDDRRRHSQHSSGSPEVGR